VGRRQHRVARVNVGVIDEGFQFGHPDLSLTGKTVTGGR